MDAQDGKHERIRLLVADDDPEVRALVRASLEATCVVTEACSAEEAMQVLASTVPFALIVTDYIMPGINGLEFIERARRTGLAATTPFVLISGFGLTSLETSARAAGASEFLRKPFSVDQLRRVVGKILGSDRPAA